MVHGRDAILEIATNLIVRGSPMSAAAERDERRIPPVLILTGPGGSGKTAVLAELDRRLGDQPHVRLDAVRPGQADPPSLVDLLTTVIFEFIRHGAYRKKFSRFLVGRLITEMTLDDDLTVAYEQAKDKLGRFDPTTLGGQIAAMFALLPDETGGPAAADAVGQFVPSIVEGLTRTSWGRRVTLLTGHKWYGHRDRNLKKDAIAELVDLNRQRHHGGDEGKAAVNRTLMAAFLADVRHAARRGSTVDPVVLLDNADNDSGLEFLRALEKTRFEPGVDYEHDHLTVITTSNGSLVEWLKITDDEVPRGDPTVVERVRTGRLDVRGPWLPLPLRDLTGEEMLPLAEDVGIPARHRYRIVRMLRDLTAGHPGGTALLMRAAVLAGPDIAYPEDMLALPMPGSPRPGNDRHPPDTRSAADLILDMFLADLPGTLHFDLTTCAAARDRDEAGVIAGSPMIGTAFGDQQPLLSAAYWAPREPGGKPVMHPLLRLLLLRKLAQRPAAPRTAWRGVFGLLAEKAENEDDRMHHQFARGDVTAVVERLVTLLGERSGRQWLALVRSLASCPAHPDAAHAEFERTGDELTDAVTAVLTAWRGSADPTLIGRRAHLHGVVYTEMPIVARKARGDRGDFVSVAAHHQAMAKRWLDVQRRDPADPDPDELGSTR
ncbi:hypothetical protein ALI22I_29010 [Saccharothrix sp. ALI-22-I]|nr:hypothetical protein ALI22I_29010 [Saccharothrix sp. ALI-22-I]